MMKTSRVPCAPAGAAVTVSFVERFQASEQFDRVFGEGMALVERTAAYLDCEGRAESRALCPALAVLYATESMRLTTRLLDLASWLLIRRAVKSGEIGESEARTRRQRVKMQSVSRPSHTERFAELPLGLQRLVEASFALQDRIMHLDRAFAFGSVMPVGPEETVNPVARQVQLLAEAFCAEAC